MYYCTILNAYESVKIEGFILFQDLGFTFTNSYFYARDHLSCKAFAIYFVWIIVSDCDTSQS